MDSQVQAEEFPHGNYEFDHNWRQRKLRQGADRIDGVMNDFDPMARDAAPNQLAGRIMLPGMLK